ncbi:hypothetical protein [Streptomyces sp. NPDC059994]|uniref:hypothetical protein n=1 Tax=Streptomyces sp. NPDC059994 TaxID=3347029 RepID=UPI00368AD365
MVEAEEIESLPASGEADDAGLLRMQSHPEPFQHLRCQLAGLFGPLFGRRQDHEIIALPHQCPQPAPFALPRLIENVQRDIRQLPPDQGDDGLSILSGHAVLPRS